MSWGELRYLTPNSLLLYSRAKFNPTFLQNSLGGLESENIGSVEIAPVNTSCWSHNNFGKRVTTTLFRTIFDASGTTTVDRTAKKNRTSPNRIFSASTDANGSCRPHGILVFRDCFRQWRMLVTDNEWLKERGLQPQWIWSDVERKHGFRSACQVGVANDEHHRRMRRRLAVQSCYSGHVRYLPAPLINGASATSS